MDDLRETAEAIGKMSPEERSQLFPIEITRYSEAWPIFYQKEAARIVEAVGREQIFRINHFGSTSVEGLAAKPTIDILLEIKQQSDVPSIVEKIENLGYLYSYQPDNPAPHALFYKGYTLRGFKRQVIHLHMRYPGDWHELYFRDYLRSHPEELQAYARLKMQLLEQYRFDRDGYTNAKGEFILAVVENARKAFPNRYTVD